MFAGFLIEAPDPLLWDVTAPSAAFDAERHGFGWLDDLAAVGDAAARVRAQRWTWGWIEAHGRGQGAGWQADLTGRRVIRWINHAIFLLRGQPPEAQAAFFRALARQARFLARRWRRRAGPAAVRGPDRAALCRAHAEGKEALAPALRALVAACRAQIDASGGLPTRNPEELLEVFTLLTWAAAALAEAGRAVPAPLSEAIARIAPTLRALRHADGGLARFHGGGRGLEGGSTRRWPKAASGQGARPADGSVDGLCAAARRAHQRDRRCRAAAVGGGVGGRPCLDPRLRADLGAGAR
jgi:uncharacterized heparinase superfamily protein